MHMYNKISYFALYILILLMGQLSIARRIVCLNILPKREALEILTQKLLSNSVVGISYTYIIYKYHKAIIAYL